MKKTSNVAYLVSRGIVNLMSPARQHVFLFGLILILAFSISEVRAQVDSTRIAVVPTFDKVYDRFGNTYNLSDIMFEPEVSVTPKSILYTGCNSGYFRLYLEPGSGVEDFASDPIHQERLNIICQVFQDISSFIIPADPNNPVNIWIRKINGLPNFSSNTLGLASSFYTLAPNVNGIVDGTVWQTINSGHDAYTSVVSPLLTINSAQANGVAFYHGIMAFNFDMPDWYTGPLTAGPTGTQFDLYGVVLHEVTHALGFASLMTNLGNSFYDNVGDYYARYDLRLGNSSSTPLLTQTANTCGGMYDYIYSQPSLSAITPNINSCGTPNNTTCTAAARFVSLGLNQAIYTPNCWVDGGSLSHFEDLCITSPANDGYFIMSNQQLNPSQPGFVLKRSYTPEEYLALCSLGYRVGTSFGTNGNLNNFRNYGGSCGVSVAGTNDGVNANSTFSYVGAINTPITISGILSNDFTSSGTLSYECVQVVSGTTSSTLPTTGTADFTYTPTSSGIHILRYIPVSGTQKGNITYIIIAVTSGNCAPSTCNFVANGGFEASQGCGILSPPGLYSTTSDCWREFGGTADIVAPNCSVSPHFNLNGLYFLTPVQPFGNFSGGLWGAPLVQESIQQQLPIALASGNYRLRFKARVANRSNFANITNTLTFWGHSGTTPFAYIGLNSISFLQNNSFINLAAQAIPNNDQWNIYDIPITINSNIGTFIISTTIPTIAGVYTYTLIDDVEIISEPLNHFNFPDASICQTLSPINLNNYVDVSGGTFTGTGVSNNVFDPIVAGAGTHLITYTYTDNLGCIVQLVDNIDVVATPTVSIMGITNTCNNAPTTLAASGVWDIYVWSNSAGQSEFAPTYTVSQSGIYSLLVSDASGNCTATASTTVNISAPIAAITGHASVCEGATTTLLASMIGGTAPFTYTWSNGGGNGVSATFGPIVTTTYSVTITDANGCSASASHILTVIPAPVVSITGNNSICVGASTILTASGGNSYTWSNNLGNNATSLPITASGTYSVTATDVNSCTASASVAVNVNLNVPNINIAQTGSSCIGGSLQLTATGSTSTYEWGGPNGYSATGGAINITASLLPSTVDYTVTATAANGCTASATTQVSVDPTCLMCGGSTTTIDLLITEPDLATFIANNSAYPDNLTGLNIYVANNFEINTGNSSGNPYLIDNCHITFASGVQLIIPNGRQLTIDNSTLESCEFLWVGIFADEQSALRMSNSTITDAYLAIMANDQCKLELNNTLFDRNYIGIYSNQIGSSFTLAMQNTTFDCTATLLPLDGMPLLQNWAYAGIDLENIGYLDITSPSNNTSTLNVFKNVANGIVAYKCGHLGVQNCKFLNILPRPQFTDHYNGSAIAALETKTLEHIGLGTGVQLFSNCNFGVYNQQSNIFVNETRMDKMNIGVYSRLCNTGERIIVTNNYINTNRTSAVYLWQCDGASYVDVANNAVSVSRPNSSTTARHGILVNNFGTGASGFTRIRCNAVQVDNGWNGVNILNGEQYKVLENEVLLTDVNINQQGINVSNNNATAVLQNIVNSTFRSNTQNSIHYSPTAIKADNSVDGLYSDNLMSNTYTGLLMAGVSSGSEVKQNQFGDHYWGMNFTTTLVLNDQVDKGNTWIGTYGNADARHEGVPYFTSGNVFKLQGYFETLFGGTYTPSTIITTDPAANPSMWFDNSGVNPNIIPPASYCVEYAGGGDIVKRLSTHDIAIAKGELVTAEYPEEMEWWAKERLYNLLKDSIAWSLDTTLVNFKDSSELTTSKAFYDLRQDYKTWLSPDASLEAQYETVMASMQDQEALIKAKQEEIAVADSTQLAALYVELGILTSDYKDLKVLLEQVKLSLETLRTQTAEDIKGNNAAINTAALYESNQKVVNDIYYSTIAKGYGEFRPAQVALLANIANQCPFAGGPAVYQARSLYAAVVDTLYDDKAICQQVNIAYRPTSTTLTESASQAFKVFPNPAQTDLTVLTESALTEDTQLSLINTLGQVELSVWLNKGTTQKTISLAAIPNGLYICKIGQSVSYKLIVMKP